MDFLLNDSANATGLHAHMLNQGSADIIDVSPLLRAEKLVVFHEILCESLRVLTVEGIISVIDTLYNINLLKILIEHMKLSEREFFFTLDDYKRSKSLDLVLINAEAVQKIVISKV